MNLDIIAFHILSQLSHPTLTSNTLDCGKTSSPKLKILQKKELIQVGEVLIILTGDTYCHIQGLYSALYALRSMQNGKVSCMLILNSDRHLLRDL